MAAILDVGQARRTPAGYRRFAWSDADLTLAGVVPPGAPSRAAWTSRRIATATCGRGGCRRDGPANRRDAFVTGSHLDSVPDGGAFDGPLGVVSAFAAIDIVRERGVVPTIPVAVAAFSDEEGARFGVACVGSQLSTGALSADRARGLRDNDGVTLAEALTRAGRDPEHLGADRRLAERVGVFVELHVEQGRALDLVDRSDRRRVGDLAARALGVHVRRRGEPRGHRRGWPTDATRCWRSRPRCTPRGPRPPRTRRSRRSARCIVSPNGANAIPSRIRAWLDARAADEATLTALVDADHRRGAPARSGRSASTLDVTAESRHADRRIPRRSARTPATGAGHLGDIPVLPTQAGHDAGILSAMVPTAMLFVRNPTGVSHSPQEHAEIDRLQPGGGGAGRRDGGLGDGMTDLVV